MEREEWSLTSTQGYRLHCLQLRPAAQPRALVFVIHGFGDHCGWYEIIAEDYLKNGAVVIMHDHVGHGKSEGPRFNISHFDVYVDDILKHIKLVREKFPDLPLYIYGHSMGGALALLTGLRQPSLMAGTIISGAAIQGSPESLKPWMAWLGRSVGRLVPWLPVPASVDDNFACRDPEMVKNQKEDPLNNNGSFVKAGWGRALLLAFDIIHTSYDKMDWPLLIQHGSDDKICDPDGARNLYQNAASQDKTLLIYDGGYHSIHREIDGMGEKVREEAASWFNERVSRNS